MNQFDQPPQTSEQPKYTQEQLIEYLRDTDGALSASVKVLTRGFEEDGVYKPWPKTEIKKILATILSLFEVKVKYYEGAGESEKAINVEEKFEELKKTFSVIDDSEEVPQGFLETVQQAVENE